MKTIMTHPTFPCTYLNFFSDAQLEDENPNLHPTRRALLSYVSPHQRITLPTTHIIVEEDTFGDDEASDGYDSDGDKFWDCENKTNLSVDRLAILTCLDTNPSPRRIFKVLTISDDGLDDCSSDCDESDFSAYTAFEGVESPSSQNLPVGTDANSSRDLSVDIKCDSTHALMGGLESITFSEDEDAGISSDDDSLFAQYGALLPTDKLPEKYKRCHCKLMNHSSVSQSSIPRGCYRILDFLSTNAFSEVVIAQSMAGDKKDSGLEHGRLYCIKIYREGWPLPLPENTRPELKAETKAYQRLSEAIGSKRPGLQFLMQIQAILHDESQTFFIMVRVSRLGSDLILTTHRM